MSYLVLFKEDSKPDDPDLFEANWKIISSSLPNSEAIERVCVEYGEYIVLDLGRQNMVTPDVAQVIEHFRVRREKVPVG